MDREFWHATVHRVSKSQTELSDQTELMISMFNFVRIHKMDLQSGYAILHFC